ncbi:TonB-dependent receptor [candidate division KSB1 bacterium]|nr:TonB-dependent receptor [candidate division KSB1 bacterium]
MKSNKKLWLLILSFFLCVLQLFGVTNSTTINVTGKIVDSKTKMPLPGANILVESGDTGTTTNTNGEYRLILAPGEYTILVTFMGYEPSRQKLSIRESETKHELNFMLEPKVLTSGELVVIAQSPDPAIARYEIKARDLHKIPTPLPDALIMLKTLPGVSALNDQSSFYNIRGGNFDENLIYINGIEIYQPHIVRKAIMENPSLVNVDLVKKINLRTGAFPVYYGDKLSSVLDISYTDDIEETHGSVDISTIGVNAVVQTGITGNFSVLFGLRKINYGYLLNNLTNTETDYHPDYTDLQTILNYKPTSRLKFSLTGLYADSKYESSPQEWSYWRKNEGYFNMQLDGNENLNYRTELWAFTAEQSFDNVKINFQSSRYKQKEKERTDLAGVIFFTNDHLEKPNTENYDLTNILYHNVSNSFSSTIYNNHLSVDFYPDPRITLRTGVEYKKFMNKDALYESHIIQEDTLAAYKNPSFNYSGNQNIDGYLLAGYAQAGFQFIPELLLQAGLRLTTSGLNQEKLLLPRFRLSFNINNTMQILLAAGQYAQPPMYKEFQFRDENPDGLLAQKSTVLTLGLQKEYTANKGFKVEAYYKKLKDIISYEIRDVKLYYSGRNDAKGYAYGLDAYLHFQYPRGTENWFSYSYLVAREKLLNSQEGYVPRPSDRRHQFSLLMEDRMEKFKNSRIHVRFVWGSAYPFTWENWVLNQDTGEYEFLKGRRNHSRLTLYQRFDVGFTQELNLGKKFKLILREEVLNTFNNINLLGYDFMFNRRVDYYMSGRVYNLGLRLEI